MSREYAGFDVEKLAVPSLVHDATLPATSDDIGAGAKTGVMIAVVGPLPTVPSVAFFDPDLGYCVWTAAAAGAPVTVSDGMGGFSVVFDEDGNVVYA